MWPSLCTLFLPFESGHPGTAGTDGRDAQLCITMCVCVCVSRMCVLYALAVRSHHTPEQNRGCRTKHWPEFSGIPGWKKSAAYVKLIVLHTCACAALVQQNPEKPTVCGGLDPPPVLDTPSPLSARDDPSKSAWNINQRTDARVIEAIPGDNRPRAWTPTSTLETTGSGGPPVNRGAHISIMS